MRSHCIPGIYLVYSLVQRRTIAWGGDEFLRSIIIVTKAQYWTMIKSKFYLQTIMEGGGYRNC